MRNAKKDEKEMAAKRELMLETGFRMFTEGSIEAVSMQQIADACNVGFATIYRYFRTKPDLVAAICARQWDDYFREVDAEYLKEGVEAMDAAGEFSFYLDCFIRLYSDHADMLRFNQNFNSYVRHEGVTQEQMKELYGVIGRFRDKFHVLYEKGEADGTLVTDMGEEKLFNSTMHIMLAACIRFAEGLLVKSDYDMSDELLMLKDMMTDRFTAK